ncbi:MAG: NAD(P)-dependent glycerol-3-phosphate dehydrogenase [Pseudonocardiales bacterium]|nr:NAD(P)-dependent glycerol-3-phosphate dehydrogenase [Pseudonocardiales bacterium]MBV9032657.1 NAD(P)-dependent glycerol-3-phosphate dehydrogenase [Pseudonocardiales bacterium]
MTGVVQRIAVMGAGSWGTTFAKVLADAGRDVMLWARRTEVADAVAHRHTNPDYLPGVTLPASLRATARAKTALDGVNAVVLALPSQTLRDNLLEWHKSIPPEATLVSLAKGVELDSLKRMSEVVLDVTAVAPDQVVVVSGPNLAREIAAEQPTASVVACIDHDRAVAVQHACGTGYFRPYTNTDVIGCELGGACKNVIALACGVAAGLGYGDNTLATLITRGLAEMARLGAALGADPMTFAGLAGLGDLVATCFSPLSRNRSFGYRLGLGDTLEQAQRATHGQVVEGVKSCSSIQGLAARCGVEVPIADSVRRVCYEGQSPRQMAAELLGRAHGPE